MSRPEFVWILVTEDNWRGKICSWFLGRVSIKWHKPSSRKYVRVQCYYSYWLNIKCKNLIRPLPIKFLRFNWICNDQDNGRLTLFSFIDKFNTEAIFQTRAMRDSLQQPVINNSEYFAEDSPAGSSWTKHVETRILHMSCTFFKEDGVVHRIKCLGKVQGLLIQDREYLFECGWLLTSTVCIPSPYNTVDIVCVLL